MEMNNVYNILTSYGLSNEEIDEIIDFCPALDIVDAERILKNIAILEQFGYPSEDMDTYILTNPKFLIYAPQELIKKLSSLGGDIEEKLKNNPYLI